MFCPSCTLHYNFNKYASTSKRFYSEMISVNNEEVCLVDYEKILGEDRLSRNTIDVCSE